MKIKRNLEERALFFNQIATAASLRWTALFELPRIISEIMTTAANYWGLPLLRISKVLGFKSLQGPLARPVIALLAAAVTLLLGAPNVQARYASIVIDYETGQVLQEINRTPLCS